MNLVASPLARERGSGEGFIRMGNACSCSCRTPHLCPLPFGRGEATRRVLHRCGRRLGRFGGLVKVDVRLVSFPPPGVRNDSGSNDDQVLRSRRTPRRAGGPAAAYVSCRNVFSSSVSPSIFATISCNDCIAAATCLRKCLCPLTKPRNP